VIVSIAAIVVYAGLYGLLHSLLASDRAKRIAREALGPAADRWYRLAYNVEAGLLLLPGSALLVVLPDSLLYEFASPWRWLAMLAQASALVGMAYGVWLTDPWHFLGLRQIAGRAGNADSGRLVVAGPYRVVRHPLYTLGLILMWLTPRMSVNLFALFAAFTVYIVVGTLFEERRLVREYGDAYREYRRRVPRLIPRLRA
jgi:protein-S-isoprenylcysteine O-methyltransferase Ste14